MALESPSDVKSQLLSYHEGLFQQILSAGVAVQLYQSLHTPPCVTFWVTLCSGNISLIPNPQTKQELCWLKVHLNRCLQAAGGYFIQVGFSFVIKKLEPIYSMLSIILSMSSAPFAGRRLVFVSCRLLSPKCCSSSSLINVFIRELSHNLYSKCQSSTTVALKLLSNMQSWQIPAWNTHAVKEETVSQPCKASQISKQKPLWDMWKGDTNDGRKNSLLEKYDGSDEKDWLHRKPILHYW